MKQAERPPQVSEPEQQPGLEQTVTAAHFFTNIVDHENRPVSRVWQKKTAGFLPGSFTRNDNRSAVIILDFAPASCYDKRVYRICFTGGHL